MDKLLRAILWTAGIVLVIGGLARALFVDVWTIPAENTRFGISMEPTLTGGDTVLMLSLGVPGFGDLVRCTDPDDPKSFVVGRIAGLVGDVVEVNGRDLRVNDKRYLSEQVCPVPKVTVVHPTSKKEVDIFCDEVEMGGRIHYRGYSSKNDIFMSTKTNVGGGMVFLLSDDRSYHDDSRDFGVVPIASCKNRIFFRLWGKDGWSDERRRLSYVR